MPEAFVQQVPRTPEEWQRLWSFTVDAFSTCRRPTRVVHVGDVGIGGTNPIRIQSMAITDTLDTDRVVDEISALARAGCEIVRVTAPNRTAAENLGNIRDQLRRRGIHVPLVADVHFTPQAALIAAEHVEKVRINPGNYADRKHFKKWEYSDAEYAEELERLEAAFRPLVLRCRERGVAMRIGTNHGSLSDRILNRFGDTPQGMVESALEFVRICAHHDYHELVLSMKASDVKVMIAAYRLLARRLRELHLDYPLHLGVTEAGSGLAARVKSAIGIAGLLADGIGDTIRVSLTEDSLYELPVARALARSFAVPFVAASRPPARAAMASRASRPQPFASPTSVPPWDPTFYARRAVVEIGEGPARLSADQAPRIEWMCALPQTSGKLPNELHQILRGDMPLDDTPDLVWFQIDGAASAVGAACAQLRDAVPPEALPLGLEIPLEVLADSVVQRELQASPWQRLSLRLPSLNPAGWQELLSATTGTPLQLTFPADWAFDREGLLPFARAMLDGLVPLAALSLLPTDSPPATLHAWRHLLATWPDTPRQPPVVLRGATRAAEPVDGVISQDDLATAWELGSLVADGVGDALQLQGPSVRHAAQLAREILQSTRARLSKADFIACPSCGRTQFDLQSTTARIQARLQHLKGLKIAVMGCIVNGPGEMADADFGYVGSGPGRIDLYVRHERVERNVPEAEAVERLIDLIRRHGRWRDPGA